MMTFNTSQLWERQRIFFFFFGEREGLFNRTKTEALIFVKVSYVSGNQVKRLWPSLPFTSADFCSQRLCDVGANLKPPALMELMMVKDSEPCLSQRCGCAFV